MILSENFKQKNRKKSKNNFFIFFVDRNNLGSKHCTQSLGITEFKMKNFFSEKCQKIVFEKQIEKGNQKIKKLRIMLGCVF